MAKDEGAAKPKVEGAAKPKVINFDWAFNPTKLHDAKKYAEGVLGLKPGTQEHHDATKERYIALHGRLATQPLPHPQKQGGVVNLADDDGSEDIDNDE